MAYRSHTRAYRSHIQRGLVTTLLVAVALAMPGRADSQQIRRGDVVLHEYLDPSLLRELDEGDEVPAEAAASVTIARRAGDPPELSLEAGEHEMILSADGPIAEAPIVRPNGQLDPRADAHRLDGETDRVDELNYFTQFDPSVIPYKRVVAQNRVVVDADGQYAVSLFSRRDRGVVVEGGAGRPGEDVFWGTFLVRMEPGVVQPIPSVAPDQRFLRVETEPPVALRIVRDDADNFYVSSDYAGLVRLNVQLAAPRFYFDGELRPGVRWSEFPASLLPPMPDVARAAAGNVLSSLGLSGAMAPHAALMRLIEHFRDFEGRPLPAGASRGDLYETIALGKIGVCRHRSLSFVVTAHALGLPARYVYNETHAFVEVYWPGQGWRRVDLGGAAEDVNVRQGGDRPVHDGQRNDPLPRPPAYLAEIDRILGDDAPGGDSSGDPSSGDASSGDDSSGSPASEATRASNGADDTHVEHDGHAQATVNGSEPASTSPATPSHGDPADLPPGALEATDSATAATAADLLDPASAADPAAIEVDPRQAVRLRIVAADREVFRGRAIAVRGELRDASGQPLAARTVRIMLGPVGAAPGSGALELGTTVTGRDGRFEGRFDVARNVSIGRWMLYALFEGDEAHQPAASVAP